MQGRIHDCHSSNSFFSEPNTEVKVAERRSDVWADRKWPLAWVRGLTMEGLVRCSHFEFQCACWPVLQLVLLVLLVPHLGTGWPLSVIRGDFLSGELQ